MNRATKYLLALNAVLIICVAFIVTDNGQEAVLRILSKKIAKAEWRKRGYEVLSGYSSMEYEYRRGYWLIHVQIGESFPPPTEVIMVAVPLNGKKPVITWGNK